MIAVNVTEAQILAWITPIFWPFIRTLAIFGTVPVLSMRAVPTRTKIALSFLIAFCAQSSLKDQPAIGFNDVATLGVVVHEVAIGLIIGFVVRMVFSTVELAGEFMGLQMGLNFAMFFDPMSSGQVSAVSKFLGNMMALVFIVINGHLMVIAAVIQSYKTFPVNGGLLTSINSLKLYQMGSDLFATALWIALPLIGILLLVNLTMGIVGRIAPQINIFAIGFPITLSVGLMTVTAGLPLLETPIVALFQRAIGMFGG